MDYHGKSKIIEQHASEQEYERMKKLMDNILA